MHFFSTDDLALILLRVGEVAVGQAEVFARRQPDDLGGGPRLFQAARRRATRAEFALR